MRQSQQMIWIYQAYIYTRYQVNELIFGRYELTAIGVSHFDSTANTLKLSIMKIIIKVEILC